MSRLSADAIRAGIAGRVGAYLDALEVFDTIDSTNSYLLGAEAPGIGRCRVALAEVQTAGRGRRSRRWLSPRGAGVYLSLAYTFPRRQQGLPSLALAIGCGVARLLQEFGARDIGLKWPNDVLSGGAKLCGILSEVAPANREGLTVVIGVGLNVNLAAAEGESPAEAGAARVTDLAACCDEAPARGDIAAAVIAQPALWERTSEALAAAGFRTEGFAPFLGAWRRFDVLRGRQVRIDTDRGIVDGVADGVDSDGALLLNTASGVRRVTSGTVVPGR